MITLRFAAATLAAALLAACGSGSVATSPIPAPSASATAAPASAVIAAGSAAAQALPAANGSTATVALAVAAGTATGATVAVTASSAPPAGTAVISALRRSTLAITRTALAYYTFVPSADIQLTTFPAFTISFPANILPAGTALHEAFLDGSTTLPAYTYDVASGANGVTFTTTAAAPKLLAGKSYVFVFYIESGSGASPTPAAAATPTPTPSSSPGATAAPAGDITVPASISTQSLGGPVNITDIAYFGGFGGSHVFGRGGAQTDLFANPTLITDCKLTVSATNVKLEGGGQTYITQLITNNPNTHTQVIAFNDTAHVGGVETLFFFDIDGTGITVAVAGSKVIAVSGGKGNPRMACNNSYGTSVTTDRSLDTLTLSPAAVQAFITKNGGNNNFTQTAVNVADLGGAAGTAVLGRGYTTANFVVTGVVTDCTVTLSGGTMTIAGGAFSQSYTFSGLSSDTARVVAVPTAPTQITVAPTNGRVFVTFDNFGFVMQASSLAADGSSLTCPA